MSTTTASFQYPLIKQEAGNSVWKSMHHKASLYSDNPTAKDKERMKISLLEDMRSIAKLCDECRLHIKDYLRKNPIDDALESKEKLSLYLCNFHNTANQYTNKNIVADCTKILRPKEEAECKDIGCKREINIIKKDENNIVGLKESFDKFKEVSIKVFHALCDKYRVPYPEIKFHECPNNPLNSCTSMWIDTQTQEVMERPVVYLHPNIFGLRTIVHEFLHYIKQLSKDTIGGLDEMSIEKEAQSILNQEFPFDEIDKRDLRTTPIVKQEYKIPNTTPLIRNDTVSRLQNFPNAYRIYNKYLYNVKRRDFRREKENGGEEGGDWILDAFKGQPEGIQSQEGYESIQPIVPETEIGGTITKEDKTTNIFSFLDGLYSPFGAFFGMKNSDLNSTTTPIIISNAAQTIIKSQLSPIGSLLLTSLTSLGIFGALIASRRSLMYGDKMVMNLIGSNLLWGSLDYLRPETKNDVILGALDLGTIVSTQQWHLLPQVLLGETLMALVGESTTSLASPQSAQRNLQRATMSKGITGSGSNTIGGTAINKRQNLADLRALQKEMDLAEQKENPLLSRNVRSGAGRGGNPADVRRRGRVGSGQGVNTMPFMGDPNAVMIPSDDAGIEEEDEYESSFGMHVADGSNGNSGLDFSTSGVYNRRNTIKDIFGADQSYDNFNDTYYAEDEEYYG